jgi:hypothetical protein
VPARLRLALDQNFPADLIREIAEYLPDDLELATLHDIDRRLSGLDDRPLIIALRQLGWSGLVTNNYKMLYEPHEIAAIIATKSVIVAVEGLGHDPLRAAGAVLLELPGLVDRLLPDRSNVFLLRYQRRKPEDGWVFRTEAAKRHSEPQDALWRRHRPTAEELETAVLT